MPNTVACETLDAMCSDGDATVGILDLLAPLANWGPCA